MHDAGHGSGPEVVIPTTVVLAFATAGTMISGGGAIREASSVLFPET